MNRILAMLQEGEKFPLSLLAAHVEDCFSYWDWWWENRSHDSKLTRPEIVADGDAILVSTEEKFLVDTISHASLFGHYLTEALGHGVLPTGRELIREDFKAKLVAHLAVRAVAHVDEPLVVFAGGGYGAGKTTILGSSRTCRFLELESRSQIGVDVFKRFLPEYEILSRLGEGRASSIVQEEARSLSEELFDVVTLKNHSFIWDSSLSNRAASMKKIQMARTRGYRLHLVAVASPIEAAVERVMHRAKEIRRFAHPTHLADSHRDFARAFEQYADFFDVVHLFWNPWNPGSDVQEPRLIAEKEAGKNSLVVYGEEEFDHFSRLKENL